MKVSGLYAIVDAGVTPDLPLETLAEDYLKGGVRVIQLRDKRGIPTRFEIAKKIAALKSKYRFLFIVNDDLELAKEVNADGIHVGKDDSPIVECRKFLGPGKLIGYSSHSLEEAVEAERQGADYVAFGAIYPTPTKGPGHPIQGIEKLREVVRALKIPVVAIGGIGRDNIKEVLLTGVASVAMISALAKAPSSRDRAEEARFFGGLFNP